ncbi:MAG TPA: DUF1800 domain-containing protein [Micropepsaceae bacterium]|nr:DUF1800 domain-containing protein [Micropepsaceae bacterium]
MSLEGALAANRFGLGAKPGEIEDASNDPKAWLLSQLQHDDSGDRFSGLPATSELVATLVERRAALQAKDREAVKAFLAQGRQTYLREMAARFRVGFETAQPLRERLVRFWSNHFVVSIQKPQAALFVGAFEREAIRPHVTGRFADMVLAVERHPAMQLYLDNAQSIGPDSVAGMRTRKGLNENLGREILELHTLGVDGGYTQDDVIALAKILTGWSIDRGPGPAAQLMNAAMGGTSDGGFRFYPPRHEPGPKTLLGRSYAQGFESGVAALTDLANHPATARHIANKLAIHFIADDPPQDSVKRIETAFRDSGGNLAKVYEVIIADPAAWRPEPAKFRTPIEYVTAAVRVAGGDRIGMLDENSVAPFIQSARAMGEAPFAASSPKGWPDDADSWTGSDAILQRVEWANAAAQKLGGQSDPVRLADEALGPQLGAETRTAITRAASPAQGLAILFASPEFQRR